MKTFGGWLQTRLMNVTDDEQLYLLAKQPSSTISTFQGYEINGNTFYTFAQDKKSTNQNSGVRFDAEDDNGNKVTYYGYIEEIWELDYGPNFKVPLFRCKWFNLKDGVQVDPQYGMTTVDLKNLGELAEHALNVDPKVSRLHKAGFIRELKEAEWVANPVMIVDSTAGCDRLSFLDAYSGYNQIKLKKEDQELTAFITPHGVFCYNVMTFGLKNAGATYQRCMQACLGEQIGRNIEVYIDDIMVKTKHAATLIDDLRETVDNLDRYKIKLNPKKCFFGVPGGQVLGYFISARGIEANPLKIKAILDMEPPKNLHQVQLAGRLAALSRFIAKLGEKALPFYSLMKKSEKFEWTDERRNLLII
ncbi:hypothetical protein QYE76_013691 [Lolium multiflorum]|uniref:Reverse transcriptase domain-containing protein n=1 Tax=Lolium multiflorum TaxID=4521 RepID=A0AAD8X7X2_LOLMU|nr:hypothetical protein QYE76_013691 [Lolium multiflorum]